MSRFWQPAAAIGVLREWKVPPSQRYAAGALGQLRWQSASFCGVRDLT